MEKNWLRENFSKIFRGATHLIPHVTSYSEVMDAPSTTYTCRSIQWRPEVVSAPTLRMRNVCMRRHSRCSDGSERRPMILVATVAVCADRTLDEDPCVGLTSYQLHTHTSYITTAWQKHVRHLTQISLFFHSRPCMMQPAVKVRGNAALKNHWRSFPGPTQPNF